MLHERPHFGKDGMQLRGTSTRDVYPRDLVSAGSDRAENYGEFGRAWLRPGGRPRHTLKAKVWRFWGAGRPNQGGELCTRSGVERSDGDVDILGIAFSGEGWKISEAWQRTFREAARDEGWLDKDPLDLSTRIPTDQQSRGRVGFQP